MREAKKVSAKAAKSNLCRRSAALGLSAVLLVGTVSPAFAGVGVFATEFTQLLNHVELINQYIRQGLQYTSQLQQLQQQIIAGTRNPSQLFGNVQGDLQQLGNVVQGGMALAYTMQNLNGVYGQRFPGYAPQGTTFSAQYQTWGKTVLDTVLGTLRAAGLQGNQLQSEQSILQGLRGLSGSAIGQMEAAQVGVQIGEQQVEQLQKLRELMLADLQSKAAFQSAEVQRQLTTQAHGDTFFGPLHFTSNGTVF
jgi:type IV secretion system protein TrbJ